MEKRAYVSLVLPAQDKEALLIEADKRGLGVSSLVRMLIKDFLAKRGNEKNKMFGI